MKNMIMIWSGAVGDIPAGWARCDGNNGTPDLRGKVVIGASVVYIQGNTYPTNLATDAGIALHALHYIMKVP